jgi:membrane protein
MTGRNDPYGRDATRPYHIPLKGWWQVAERVLSEASRDNLSVISAGCAFYALFAIFPALSALISLYGLMIDPAMIENQLGMLSSVLPAEAYNMVIEQVRILAAASNRTLGWSFGVSLALSIWSVMSLTQAIFAALNIAYEEEERRSFLGFYLSAFLFALVGILGGVLVLLAFVYIPLLFAYAGYLEGYEEIIAIARWPLMALFVLVLLAALYRYGPCRPSPKWSWVSVGSLFATALWLLASAGFSYYVAHFARYDKVYGSLGAVIVLLFWLYLTFYIVLLGAEINAELELQTAQDTTRGKPRPSGSRGAFVADHVAGGPQGNLRPVSAVNADPSKAKRSGSDDAQI